VLPQGARSQEELVVNCDLTPAGKGKTTTKHMTGDSEVERDLRKMKTAPPGANGENEQD